MAGERIEPQEPTPDKPPGLPERLRLPYLLKRYPARVVRAVFVLVNGFLTIGLLTTVAMLSGTPFVFPSLGPTAILLFFNPNHPTASPRNTLSGHAIGILCGYASLWLLGLTDHPSAMEEGVHVQRVFCAALVVATTYRQPPSPPALTPSPPAAPQETISSPSATPPQAEPRRTVRNLPNRAPVPRLLYPLKGATVASRDVEFRWEDVPGALYYDVRVVTEAGDVVWEGRAEKAEASLPSGVQLTAGQAFFVRVRAWLAEGKTVTSRVVRFRVRDLS